MDWNPPVIQRPIRPIPPPNRSASTTNMLCILLIVGHLLVAWMNPNVQIWIHLCVSYAVCCILLGVSSDFINRWCPDGEWERYNEELEEFYEEVRIQNIAKKIAMDKILRMRTDEMNEKYCEYYEEEIEKLKN